MLCMFGGEKQGIHTGRSGKGVGSGLWEEGLLPCVFGRRRQLRSFRFMPILTSFITYNEWRSSYGILCPTLDLQ